MYTFKLVTAGASTALIWWNRLLSEPKTTRYDKDSVSFGRVTPKVCPLAVSAGSAAILTRFGRPGSMVHSSHASALGVASPNRERTVAETGRSAPIATTLSPGNTSTANRPMRSTSAQGARNRFHI